MGKLITVVGNSGVGKTTFASKLCEIGSFTPFLEITEEKPFLQKFHDNRKIIYTITVRRDMRV